MCRIYDKIWIILSVCAGEDNLGIRVYIIINWNAVTYVRLRRHAVMQSRALGAQKEPRTWTPEGAYLEPGHQSWLLSISCVQGLWINCFFGHNMIKLTKNVYATHNWVFPSFHVRNHRIVNYILFYSMLVFLFKSTNGSKNKIYGSTKKCQNIRTPNTENKMMHYD